MIYIQLQLLQLTVTTSATIITMTGATSVDNTIIIIDTGAATLESEVMLIKIIISIIIITQTKQIRILMVNNIPLIKIEQVEWVGFNK